MADFYKEGKEDNAGSAKSCSDAWDLMLLGACGDNGEHTCL